MIDVKNEIKIYEINGEDKMGDDKKLIIKSHWNLNRMVIIEFLEGEKITVCAEDLKAAIDNAINTVRF